MNIVCKLLTEVGPTVRITNTKLFSVLGKKDTN